MIWSPVLDWSQQSLASLCEDFLGPCDIRVSYQRVAGKFLCSSIEMPMEVTGTFLTWMLEHLCGMCGLTATGHQSTKGKLGLSGIGCHQSESALCWPLAEHRSSLLWLYSLGFSLHASEGILTLYKLSGGNPVKFISL